MRFRLTVRARLALTYAALVTLAGGVMIAVVYLLVGVMSSFAFASPAVAATEIEGYADAAPTTESPATYPDADEAQPARAAELDAGSIATRGTSAGIVVASRDDIQQLIVLIAVVVLALLAVGGGWLGWWLAGRMLRPLQMVNAAAHRASTGELDHRIELEGPRDELKDLADTFDHMLVELERSFQAQRRFAANASHELRTPLATTRAVLDVALSTAPEASRSTLVRLRETNERSIRTVEALLDLAEIEGGDLVSAPVELDVIVEEALRETADEAADAAVVVERRLDPVLVEGNAVLLRQLLTNLVQNAIRHGSSPGFLRVSTSEEGGGDDGGVVLRVENGGAPIDPDTLEALREPFSRSGGRAGGAGRGLGLSIVGAIAERHGWGLHLEARPGGGLLVTVRFRPAAPQPVVPR